jgi:L-rhamnose mutarotase
MMEAQTPHACGVDDIACHLRCLRQILFFAWVSLNEQKWVTFGERRSAEEWKNRILEIPEP